MTMRALLKAARWTGFLSAGPSQPRPSARRRRLSIESLEERRVLAASSFAAALYQDVLGRAADSAGLTYYTNQLAQSTAPSTVVASFWDSAEHFGTEVDHYYQTFFNRAADAAGRQAWVSDMLAGVTEETVMADFLNSPEFQQLNPTPTQFVTALYQDVLGRAPDAAGLSGFVTGLTNQTAAPSDVISSFINSTERHVNLVDSYYALYLQRAPDAAGQSLWVQSLDLGTLTDASVAQSILESPEFIANNPLPPLVAGPGQVVVTIVGSGSVTDSTGQIDTSVGHNVAVYGPSDTPTLQASSAAVTWSDPALVGQTVGLIPSDFANGLNLTVFVN
jgi:hypothetical protein